MTGQTPRQCSDCGETIPDEKARLGATMCSACSSRRPSLIHYLASAWFFRVVEKGWFGKKRIRLGTSLHIDGFLCETGAILGRARREQLELLASMFATPGTENVAVQMCHGLAKRQLELYAGEPENTSWGDFFLRSELAKLGVEDPHRWLLAHGASKVPLDSPWKSAQNSLLAGIGLGGLFPDLVEAMCRRQYVYPSEEELKWLRALGIWEDTEKVTFEEREQGVLWEVAAFVETHYPDLMAPLRLQIPA